jgi:hypothetical protein
MNLLKGLFIVAFFVPSLVLADEQVSLQEVLTILESTGVTGEAQQDSAALVEDIGRCNITFQFVGTNQLAINFHIQIPGLLNDYSGSDVFSVTKFSDETNYGDVMLELNSQSGRRISLMYRSPNTVETLKEGRIHLTIYRANGRYYNCFDQDVRSR